MDPELLAALMAALQAGDVDAAMALLADAAPGEPPAGEADESALEGAADPKDPEVVTEDDPEEDEARAAALTALRDLSGVQDVAGAIELCTTWRDQAKETAARHEATDARVRASLVGALVKLGAETPATAWADPVKFVPCDRLAAESVESLSARVKALRAVGTRKGATPPVTSLKDSGVTIELSELEQSKTEGMTDAVKARFIELRASKRQQAS